MSGVVEKLRRCVAGTKPDLSLDMMFTVELRRYEARVLVDLFDDMTEAAADLRATLAAREGALDEDRRHFIRQAAIELAAAPFGYHVGSGEFVIHSRMPQDAVREAIALWDELQKAGV